MKIFAGIILLVLAAGCLGSQVCSSQECFSNAVAKCEKASWNYTHTQDLVFNYTISEGTSGNCTYRASILTSNPPWDKLVPAGTAMSCTNSAFIPLEQSTLATIQQKCTGPLAEKLQIFATTP
jgi:hypothetical protein